MVKGSVVANSPLLPEKELGQAPFVAAHARNVPTVRVSPRIWRRMLPQSRSTVKSSIPMLMAQKKTMRRMLLPFRLVWLSRSSRTVTSSSRAAAFCSRALGLSPREISRGAFCPSKNVSICRYSFLVFCRCRNSPQRRPRQRADSAMLSPPIGSPPPARFGYAARRSSPAGG